MFESNNNSVALNILYVTYNTEEIRLAYKSKYDLKRENQVIYLMITDGIIWHHLAVKRLSVLLRGITSKYVGEFYCLNCFSHIVQTINSRNIKMYGRIMIISM